MGITRDYHLGEKEVTQKQFKAVMGYNPSHFSQDGEGGAGLEYKYGKPAGGKDKVTDSTDDYPVENVSWEEAMEFCRKLTVKDRKEGRIGRRQKYRLPTEAEWEYACRAGEPSYQTFHFGDSLSSAQANFNGDFPYGSAAKGPPLGRTTKVGSYEKNAFGLYDMHGNVFEWCMSYKEYDASRRRLDPEGVVRAARGGGWNTPGWCCRSAHRATAPLGTQFPTVGFRVALVMVNEDDSAFVAGSVWKGMQIQHWEGVDQVGRNPVTVTVLKREGDTFSAQYEIGRHKRVAQGTIKNGQVTWKAKDVKVEAGHAGQDTSGSLEGADNLELVFEGIAVDSVHQGKKSWGVVELKRVAIPGASTQDK